LIFAVRFTGQLNFSKRMQNKRREEIMHDYNILELHPELIILVFHPQNVLISISVRLMPLIS